MVNGKHKGNKWENDILKDIRKFYRDAYKSLGSGCTKDDRGDVVYRDYMIEAKHHKKFSRNELNKYWKKVCEEAAEAQKHPILIFKENGKDAMVMCWGWTYGSNPGEYKVLQYYDEWLLQRSIEEQERG